MDFQNLLVFSTTHHHTKVTTAMSPCASKLLRPSDSVPNHHLTTIFCNQHPHIYISGVDELLVLETNYKGTCISLYFSTLWRVTHLHMNLTYSTSGSHSFCFENVLISDICNQFHQSLHYTHNHACEQLPDGFPTCLLSGQHDIRQSAVKCFAGTWSHSMC